MEIFPHVHQVRSHIADRHLFQYIFDGDNTVLLDTGFSSTPEDVIFPELKKLGIQPDRVKMAINTHADADHHGGNAAIKKHCPDILLACGDLDRLAIEDPDRLFATRYNQWFAEHEVGLATNPEAQKWVREMTGPPQRIDLTFRGGEHIAVGDRIGLSVLHVPGHSHGHLALYSPVHRAVFVGDALHGNYCPSREGNPSLPPAYFAVLAYLSTVQVVETLDIEWIYSAHWPVYHGPQVAEFLAECRSFVDRADRLIRNQLERHHDGVTLRECIDACGAALGNWPAGNAWLLMYPIHGHLDHLEQLGIASKVHAAGATRWKPV